MRIAYAFTFGMLIAGVAPASALEIGIGDTSVSVGGDGGGVSASVSSGDTSAGASVGGDGASASASSGGTSAGASVGGGGASASLSSGGTSAGAGVGGGGGTVFSVSGATSGGTTVNGLITTNDGSLLTTDTDTSDGDAGATVSLGEALALLFGAPEGDIAELLAGTNPDTDLLGPGPAPRGSAAASLENSFNRFPRAQRRAVRLSCRNVMRDPASYDLNVRQLCKLIARI